VKIWNVIIFYGQIRNIEKWIRKIFLKVRLKLKGVDCYHIWKCQTIKRKIYKQLLESNQTRNFKRNLIISIQNRRNS